jgi:hypothetical protein
MHVRARSLRLSALVLALGLVFAACGDDGDDESSEDTTTTSTTAGTTTSTTASLTSTSAVAVALDGTLLSAAEVQSTLGLSAAPQPYQGTAAAPPPPQGALSLDGIAKVYPSDAYKGLLQQGEASVGANKSHLVVVGQGGYVLNILAVKFKSAETGGLFVQSASGVATTFGGAKTNAHPEVKVGVTPGAVLVVPPAAGATNETVVTSALMPDGVFYQVSASAPPGSVKDDVVIKVLTAQAAKYEKNKASIPAS